MPVSHFSRNIVIISFWTTVALLFGFQNYIISLQRGYTCTFLATLFEEFPTYFMWSFYTILLLFMASKYPVSKGIWLRRVVFLYLPVGIILILFHSALMAVYFKIIVVSRPELTVSNYFSSIAPGRLVYHILLYLVVLSGSFIYISYEKYRRDHLQLAELEKLLAQTRLDALKMQLQPHFLFNTLNTISMLVRKKDEETATRVIAMLADMLRHVLEHREIHWVRLSEEAEFVSKYLEIEKIRFGKRLDYSLSLHGKTCNVFIPDLLLQPVVENAVKHGISKRAEGGTIEIRSELKDNFVVITVTDCCNGTLSDGFLPFSAGLGLKNISDRLERIYAGTALFSINISDGKTVATYSLPVKTDNHDGE